MTIQALIEGMRAEASNTGWALRFINGQDITLRLIKMRRRGGEVYARREMWEVCDKVTKLSEIENRFKDKE